MTLPTPGTESEKGVVKALDDLFGPSFREIGEYLADKVRFHRLVSVRKIAQKARKLGVQAGYIEPPPLKFLLPFIESASLEDDTDEVMTDLWAKLLSDASTDYDIKQVHFIRILKEISGREARLLHAIATRSRGSDNMPMSYSDEIGMARLYLARSTVADFLGRCISSHLPLDEIANSFVCNYEVPGCHIHFIDVVERRDKGELVTVEDSISGVRTDIYKEFDSLAFELLRSSSLIEEIHVDIVELDSVGIEISAWILTRLGAEFYEDCASGVFIVELDPS